MMGMWLNTKGREHSVRGWQRYDIDCEDQRQSVMHGKGLLDSDGQAVGSMVKRSFHDSYVNDTQNLVRHLAHKHS